MKRIFNQLALAGFAAAALVSCDKDVETNSGNSSSGLKTFSMTITSAAGNTTVYEPVTVLKQHNSGIISINGAEGLGGVISLNVADSLTTGFYPINATGPAIIGFSNDAGQTYFYSDSGSITIMTHDMNTDKISGKFAGRIIRNNPADTMHVTNGQFNVSY